MRVRAWCFPLAENQFRNAIVANYYQNIPGVPGQKLHFFKFELDHTQTRALMDMFTPSHSPPTNNFWTPPAAAPADEHGRESIVSSGLASEREGSNNLKSEKVVKSYADVVKKNKFEEVGKGYVDTEHASSGNESSSGLDDLDCGYTPPDREDYALSDRVDQVHQPLYPDKQGKVLSFNQVLQGHTTFHRQQWHSGFSANATETDDNDGYSCKYATEVKCAFLDESSNLPETLDAEVDKLSGGHSNLLVQLLDSESCTEAKVITLNSADICIPYYHAFVCVSSFTLAKMLNSCLSIPNFSHYFVCAVD